MLRTFSFQLLLLFLCANLMLPANIVFAAPKEGAVVRGQANIKHSGLKTEINQSSKRAIINWKEFDIAQKESVQHSMPDAGSAALHRVTGGKGASQLAGELKSNGNIFLVNPAGVVIHNGAKINTGGFLATTADIDNDDFMKGNYAFTKPGHPGASIINKGNISVRDSGFAALVAPTVRNEGVIAAKLGKVALASGDAYKLDTYGDDLINFTVPDKVVDTLYSTDGTPLGAFNTGSIKAEGGTVLLTASQLNGIVGAAVNNGGSISASSAELKGGKIVFRGEGTNVDVVNTGEVTASSENGDGGTIRMIADGKVSVSGIVKAKGAEKGGHIDISGKKETVIEGAQISTEGKEGGLIRLGGEFQGRQDKSSADAIMKENFVGRHGEQAMLASTPKLTVDSASEITAGNDGTLIAWSEGETNIQGALAGKYVETSGKTLSIGDGFTVSTGGAWLLDPDDVWIGAYGGTDLVNDSYLRASAIAEYLDTASVLIYGSNSVNFTGDLYWGSEYDFYVYSPSITLYDGVSLVNRSNGGEICLNDDRSHLGDFPSSLLIGEESFLSADIIRLEFLDITIGRGASIANLSLNSGERYQRLYISSSQMSIGADAFFSSAYGAIDITVNGVTGGENIVFSAPSTVILKYGSHPAMFGNDFQMLGGGGITQNSPGFDESITIGDNAVIGGEGNTQNIFLSAESLVIGNSSRITGGNISFSRDVIFGDNTSVSGSGNVTLNGGSLMQFGENTSLSGKTISLKNEANLHLKMGSTLTAQDKISLHSNDHMKLDDDISLTTTANGALIELTSYGNISIGDRSWFSASGQIRVNASDELVIGNDTTLLGLVILEGERGITVGDNAVIGGEGNTHNIYISGYRFKDGSLVFGDNSKITGGVISIDPFASQYSRGDLIFGDNTFVFGSGDVTLNSNLMQFGKNASLNGKTISLQPDYRGYANTILIENGSTLTAQDKIYLYSSDGMELGDDVTLTTTAAGGSIELISNGDLSIKSSGRLTAQDKIYLLSFDDMVLGGEVFLKTTAAGGSIELSSRGNLSIGERSTITTDSYASLSVGNLLDAHLSYAGNIPLEISAAAITGNIQTDNAVNLTNSRTSLYGGTRKNPVIDASLVDFINGEFYLDAFSIKAPNGVTWQNYTHLNGNSGTEPHIFGLSTGPIPDWSFPTVRVEYPLVEHPLYLVWISGATNSQAFSFDSNGIIQYPDTSVSSININSVWLSDYLDSENSVNIQAGEEIFLRDNLVWFSDNSLTLTANRITLVDGVQIYNSGQGHLLFQAGQSPKDLRIGANAYILSGSRHHQGFERTFWGDGTIFEYSASGSSYPAPSLTSPTASFATPPSLSVSTDTSGFYIGNNVTHKNVYKDGNDTIQENYVVIGDNFSMTADILEFNIQNMQVGNNARITSNKLTIDARLTDGSLLFGDGAFVNSFAMTVNDGFDSFTFGKNTTLVVNQLDLRADALAIGRGSRLFINEYATFNSQELDAAFTLSGAGSFAITSNVIKGNISAPGSQIDLISPTTGQTSLLGGTPSQPVLDAQSVYFQGNFYLEEFAVKSTQSVKWHSAAQLNGNAGTNPHILGLPVNSITEWPFNTVRLEYVGDIQQPEEENPEPENPVEPEPPVDNDEFRRAEFTLYMHLFIRQYVPGYSSQDYDTILARYVQLIREQAASDVSTGKSTYYDLLASYDYNASMQRILAEIRKKFPDYSLVLGVSDYKLFSGTLYMQSYIRAAGRTVDTNWTPTELANAYRNATIWVQNRPIYAILEQLKILDPTYDGLILEAIKGDFEATRARMLAVVQEYQNNPSWGTDNNFELKRAYDNAVGNMSSVITTWLKTPSSSITAENIVSLYKKAIGAKALEEARLAEEKRLQEEARLAEQNKLEEAKARAEQLDEQVISDNAIDKESSKNIKQTLPKPDNIVKIGNDGLISTGYAKYILPYAIVSENVYSKKSELPDGIVRLERLDEHNYVSGFEASTYYDANTNTIIITFAGTSIISIPDLAADIGVFTGISITQAQWRQAQIYYQHVMSDLWISSNLNLNIVLTGHSLGGGLAQAVGSHTGLPTYAFNSAAVPANLLGTRIDNIDLIKSFVDPVSLLSGVAGSNQSHSIFEQIVVKDAGIHGINGLIGGLKEKIGISYASKATPLR